MAADRHGVFTTTMARSAGVSDRLRLDWVDDGRIHRLGLHTFAFAGTPITWEMSLASGLGDLGPAAAISGRSVAALHHLDAFHQGPVEIWVPRAYRNRARTPTTKMSSRPLLTGDVVTIDGLRCVSAERLIVDSLLFRFTSAEIHNAIDSAIRMRLVNEKRLRERVIRDLATNAPHRRRLLGALIDTGGESALERRFLAILRQAGYPRPQLQRTYRAGTRTFARVDAEFANGLVVELAGHGTHASRVQRQRDAQRHTELTLRNRRVITFTYDDVFGRPRWMLDMLRAAGVAAAA
jgi:hypothetical protein